MTADYLPVFLNVSGRTVVVTGDGGQAIDSALRLAGLGAVVRVVSDDVEAARKALAGAAGCEIVAGPPKGEHLAAALLVVAASGDPGADHAILEAAGERGIITVGEGAAHASLGVAVTKGGLVVAASTDGACPAMDATLARAAAEGLGSEHERFAEICSSLRVPLEDRYPDVERRADIWKQIFDSPVLALLRAGDDDAAVELAERMAWGTG